MEKRMDEFFNKNNELSMEFSKYVLEHPEVDEMITKDTVIIFLPEFDPELRDFNIKMGENIEAECGKVLYVKLKGMSPKITSRLVGVELAHS